MLALQKKSVVAAETQKITSEIAAQQQQVEALVKARTELQAATVEFQRAQAETEARLKLAEAERQIISNKNQKEVAVLKEQVLAYGGGQNSLAGLLYSKVAPQIESILCQAEPGWFGLPLALPNSEKTVNAKDGNQGGTDK